MDDSNTPLEPDRVWLAEEWEERSLHDFSRLDEQVASYINMPPGPERTRLKYEAFRAAYSGGRGRFNVHGTATSRFPRPPDFQTMPGVGDVIHTSLEEYMRKLRDQQT